MAAKHAEHAIAGTLRLELYDQPVRVIEIAPGMVRTDEFALNRYRGDASQAAAVYAGVAEPLTAEDVADSIVWAVTRPPHVNVDLLVLPARASRPAQGLPGEHLTQRSGQLTLARSGTTRSAAANSAAAWRWPPRRNTRRPPWPRPRRPARPRTPRRPPEPRPARAGGPVPLRIRLARRYVFRGHHDREQLAHAQIHERFFGIRRPAEVTSPSGTCAAAIERPAAPHPASAPVAADPGHGSTHGWPPSARPGRAAAAGPEQLAGVYAAAADERADQLLVGRQATGLEHVQPGLPAAFLTVDQRAVQVEDGRGEGPGISRSG